MEKNLFVEMLDGFPLLLHRLHRPETITIFNDEEHIMISSKKELKVGLCIKWNYVDLIQSQNKQQFDPFEIIWYLINMLQVPFCTKIINLQLGNLQFFQPVLPVERIPISRHDFSASRQRSGSFRNSWDAKRKHVPDVCTAHSTTSYHLYRTLESEERWIWRLSNECAVLTMF